MSYKKEFKKDKQALIKEFSPLVKKIASRLSFRLPPDIDQEDLFQVGIIGLMEAIGRYNPNEEANFKTYAEYRIRGSMLDELRARDWIPRSVRASANKLEKATLSLIKKGIETPTQEDLAKEMGMETEEFQTFLQKNNSIPLISLNSLGKNSSQEGPDILEVIKNPDEVAVDDSIIRKEMVEHLANAIKKLPKRSQMVLSLAYQQDMNLKEVAKTLDLTEARICQIRTSSIAFLRSYLSDKIEI